MTVPNLSLVALTPSDVPAQQAQLVGWCDRTLKELHQDLSDCDDNMRIAMEHAWATANLERAYQKLKRRITYIEKIKAASEHGYLIVPNFDVEVMAVRVRTDRQQHAEGADSATSYTPSAPNLPPVRADLLAVGDGMYVDDALARTKTRWHTPDGKGGSEKHVLVKSTGYDTVDFPVVMVKPLVMDATALAMSRKIFDRIGVVTGRKEDPIVVGQIIDPRQPGSKWGRPKVVSFFIAWWFDTRVL